MTIPEPVREVVEERVGMVPLPAERGLRALERLLGPGGPQVVSLFHGRADAWHRHLAELHLLPGLESAAPADAVDTTSPAVTPDGLVELVCRTVADTLGHDPSAIGPRTSLEALGLDSVMIRTLASKLSAQVAPVGPEMLFGLRDLTELASHLARLTPQRAPAAVTVEPSGPSVAEPPVEPSVRAAAAVTGTPTTVPHSARHSARHSAPMTP